MPRPVTLAGALLESLLVSLLLTEALELPTAALLGARKKRDLTLVLLVNLITNPLLGIALDGVFLFTWSPPPAPLIAAGEVLVVGAEALLFRKRLSARLHPLLFSLILNAVSFSGGLIYEALF